MPRHVFVEQEVVDYLATADQPWLFTKALCYGSMQYLAPEVLHEVLHQLAQRFVNVERLVLGNVPDRDRADVFFGPNVDSHSDLRDPNAAIGVWWTQAELTELATRCGWSVRYQRLPEHVFNARFRYDAVLDRQ